MRGRIAAYLRTDRGEEMQSSGPSAAEAERARLAVAEVRGMSRFLRNHEDEFAQELLRLFEAVEPLVRSPQVG
jgi:hypothetical protein